MAITQVQKAEHYASRVGNQSLKVGAFTMSTGEATVERAGAGWVLDVRDVRLTRGGKPLRVDPHQRFVNPPLLDADGGPADPLKVLLDMLREQATR